MSANGNGRHPLEYAPAVYESQPFAPAVAGWLDPFAWSNRDNWRFGGPFPRLPWGGLQTHAGGAERPSFWADYDLDWARGQANWLATRNSIAVGCVERIADYTVRTGFSYEARPTRAFKGDGAARLLARTAQEVLEEFQALNSQGEGDEEYTWADREWEAVWRSVVDGESILRGFDQGDGTTLVRFVEPEQLRRPTDAGDDPDWSFGVLNARGDVGKRLAFSITYDTTDPDSDCDVVDASEVAFLKRNSRSTVKRGLPDFFATEDAFDEVAKLLKNMRVAGGVQAAIAWIEQYEGASPSAVAGKVQAARDLGRPDFSDPITGQVVNYQKWAAGSVPHITGGRKYVPPPQAVNSAAHVAVVQAALRSLAARWDMPEYMISGDSSSSNYASTLVAGAPFVVRTECRQPRYGRHFLRVLWMAIDNAAKVGRFRVNGRRYAGAELRKLLEVHPTPPQVAIANKEEEARIDQQDITAGVLSLQTRAARRGLDWDTEQANLAKHPPTRVAGKATDVDAAGNPAAAGKPPQVPPPELPGTEPPRPGEFGRGLVSEALAETLLCRDLPDAARLALLEEAAHWREAEAIQEAGAAQHKPGDVWLGPSGKRYFTKRPDGRVVPAKNPQRDAPATKPKRPTVDEVHAVIERMRGAGRASPEQTHELAGHILKLTGAEATELKKRLELKASGTKYVVASKLAARALAATKKEPPAAEVPAAPPPAPAPAAKGAPAAGPAAAEADLAALNRPDPRTGLPPFIPDLYDRLKEKHPGLGEPEFHALLRDMQKRGLVTLQSYEHAGAGGLQAASGHPPERFPDHPVRGKAAWVHTKAAATPADHAAAVAGALAAHKHGPRGANLVSLADLQDATGLSTPQLHAAVNDLRRRGVLTASGLEGREGNSPRDRAAAMDEGGAKLGYVSVRDEARDEFGKLAGGARPAAAAPPDRRELRRAADDFGRGGRHHGRPGVDEAASDRVSFLADSLAGGRPLDADDLHQAVTMADNRITDPAARAAADRVVSAALAGATPEAAAEVARRMAATIAGGAKPAGERLPSVAAFLAARGVGTKPAGEPPAAPAPAAAGAGAPTREPVRVADVDTPSQGALYSARAQKAAAWKKVQRLRQAIKDEPLGGNRRGLRLELLKAESQHAEATQSERNALGAIEDRANELGQTTKKPAAAPRKVPAGKPPAAHTPESVVQRVRAEGGTATSADLVKGIPPAERPAFDAAVIRAAEEGQVVLHRADHPWLFSEQDRADMIRDPESGDYFVAVSFRQ